MPQTKIADRQLKTPPGSVSLAPAWTSGDLAVPASNQWTTYNHSLGRKPYWIRIYLICTTAEGVFSVGDELSVIDWQANGGTNYGTVHRNNATLVGIYNWGAFNPLISNSTNWRLRVDLW